MIIDIPDNIKHITDDPLKLVGGFGLTKNRSFVGAIIRWGSRWYKKLINKPDAFVANHAFLFIDVWGELYVAEARIKGIQILSFAEALYKYKTEKVHIKLPVVPYTDEEKRFLSKTAVKYSFKQTPYQISVFVSQAIYMLTGKWIGETEDVDKSLYCSEAVAYITNKVRPGTFEYPERISPLDLDLSSDFMDYAKIDLGTPTPSVKFL